MSDEKRFHSSLITRHFLLGEVMRFWIREVVGYVLVALGLAGIYFALALFASNKIIQGAAFTVPAIFVFRGGIHLLKVAIAARICLHAQAPNRRAERRTITDRKSQTTQVPLDW